MRWWPWRRSQARQRLSTLDTRPTPLPDGNEVPLPGYRPYREILKEPIRLLPLVDPVRPYLNAHAERHQDQRRRRWPL